MAQALRNKVRLAETGAAEEVSLRIETAGYGGVPVRALVPAGVLSDIESGALPVEADFRIKLPGYGWRAVRARISPDNKETTTDGFSRLTVAGYGHTPLRMTLQSRTRSLR